MKPVFRSLLHLLLVTFMLGSTTAFAREFLVYFGTYTGPKSEGIYFSKFDSATGKLTAPELAAKIENPSFMALAPNGNHLYAAGELEKGGTVTTFLIDHKTGKLHALNEQSSGGVGPCHLALDATGKCVMVANYGSGSIASLPVKTDGSLAPAASTIQHEGSSVNTNRQAGPHAHFICPSPDNRFALACDLGTDEIFNYRLDPTAGTLSPGNPPFTKIAPGSGPRHLVFSKDGKFVYELNEMGGSIGVLAYDSKSGGMTNLQTISTLPQDFAGNSTCAEIALHPSGKFLYASNRGHDSIAVFKINPTTGKLTFIEHQTAGLHTPRHFAIAPGGKWLIAENQSNDSVVVFALDPATGKLKFTGQSISIGSPVCAVFLPL